MSETSLADRLKGLLRKNNMSARELARRLGVGHNAPHRWVNGTGYPKHDNIAELSTLFGVSPLWLVHGEELELLRDVHYQARGLLRYNGVDAKRCQQYYDQFKEAVYRVNDFDQRIEDEDDDEES